MRRATTYVVAAAVMVGASAGLAFGGAGNDGERRGGFDFALIGDMPYRPSDDVKLDRVVEDINDDHIDFTIHVGDIKSGSSRCDDPVYQHEFARMESFQDALIYTPGDNEWTDCHRLAAGAYDPLERLGFLRSVFFADPDSSLGQRELDLEFQSEEYPENARWERGRVTFATLHVVGSNNNRPAPTNPVGNEAEFQARNQANLDWLEETFDLAAEDGSIGVVLAVQANMFEDDIHTPSGFDEFLDALRSEVLAFGGPVVLVQGDSHYFRIDKPLLDAAGQTIETFTRVEVFGDRNVHWVRGTLDPGDEGVLRFDDQIVEANVLPH